MVSVFVECRADLRTRSARFFESLTLMPPSARPTCAWVSLSCGWWSFDSRKTVRHLPRGRCRLGRAQDDIDLRLFSRHFQALRERRGGGERQPDSGDAGWPTEAVEHLSEDRGAHQPAGEIGRKIESAG